MSTRCDVLICHYIPPSVQPKSVSSRAGARWELETLRLRLAPAPYTFHNSHHRSRAQPLTLPTPRHICKIRKAAYVSNPEGAGRLLFITGGARVAQ
eukprot:scaffold72772_cov57-Phaeocystis_antarctica.AAC.1